MQFEAKLGMGPDAQALDAIHHEAHDKCYIANSLKAEVTVETPLA